MIAPGEIDLSQLINWSSPLTVGLCGLWRSLPDAGFHGGLCWRDLCRRNDGLLTSMDAPTDWVATADGFAIDFDGNNDYVSLGLGPLRRMQATNQFTIHIEAAWTTALSISSGTDLSRMSRYLLANAQDIGSSGIVVAWNTPGKSILFGVGSSGVTQKSVSYDVDGLTGTGFHWLSATFDGATIRLFVGGQFAAASETSAITISSTLNGLALGAKRDGGAFSPYVGQVRHLAIYNTPQPDGVVRETVRDLQTGGWQVLNRVNLPYLMARASGRLLSLRRKAVAA